MRFVEQKLLTWCVWPLIHGWMLGSLWTAEIIGSVCVCLSQERRITTCTDSPRRYWPQNGSNRPSWLRDGLDHSLRAYTPWIRGHLFWSLVQKELNHSTGTGHQLHSAVCGSAWEHVKSIWYLVLRNVSINISYILINILWRPINREKAIYVWCIEKGSDD